MKMKDSGVEWIGEIPEEWKVEKISQLFQQRNVKVSDFDYPPLSVTKNGIVPQLESAAKSDDHTNRKLVKKNDFVINSRSDRKMSSGVSNLDGSVSLINLVMSYNHEKLNSRFVNYMMKNYGFAEEFYRWGTGIVADLWSTNWERGKNIQLPVPKVVEQQKIADFLDSKIALIDQIIADTKHSIEELKAYKQSLITETITKGLDPNVPMKDSGVEWIGKIPKEYGLTRIKYNYYLKGRIGWQGLTSADYVEEGPYLITGTDLIDGVVNWNSAVHISEENYEVAPDIHLKNNDLLISKDGTIGKVALVSSIGDKQASLNSGVLLVRNISNTTFNRYIFYVLQSDIFWRWFESKKSPNSTILHLYQGDFKDFKYPVPNYNQQEKIAKYLDSKISKVDELISEKNYVITENQSYKKSLIYEYVTGKKQVN